MQVSLNSDLKVLPLIADVNMLFAGSVPLGMAIWFMHAISMLASSFVIKINNRYEFFDLEFATIGLLIGTGIGLAVQNLTQADSGKNMRDDAYV